MPLINCPECSQEVSDTASTCPNCGLRLRKPQRGFIRGILKFCFIIFNISMPLWVVSGVMSATAEGIDAMYSAEQVGVTVDTGVGVILLITLWVVGNIMLGIFMYFTKPKV